MVRIHFYLPLHWLSCSIPNLSHLKHPANLSTWVLVSLSFQPIYPSPTFQIILAHWKILYRNHLWLRVLKNPKSISTYESTQTPQNPLFCHLCHRASQSKISQFLILDFILPSSLTRCQRIPLFCSKTTNALWKILAVTCPSLYCKS